MHPPHRHGLGAAFALAALASALPAQAASPAAPSPTGGAGVPPPRPPVSWTVNLPTSFVSIPAAGASEGFEGYGGTVPSHMAVTEIDAVTGLADPEAWCNIGQRGATTGGSSLLGPHSGSYALEMALDPSSSNYHYVRNALVIGLDGNNQTLEMDFWAADHGEETHSIDGAWVSENGSDWCQVWADWNALNISQWNSIAAVDLSGTSIDTTGRFYLMFAQEDNFPLGNLDGAQVDDVSFRVTGSLGPVLTVTPLVAGQVTTASVTGATPGGRVYFAYSLVGGGPTSVPLGPCGVVALDLSQPIRVQPPVHADASGAASLSASVPPATAGRSIWMQAYDAAGCGLSNSVATTIG